MTKAELRKTMRKVLSNLSESEKSRQSTSVLEKIIRHSKYKEARSLSIYLSTENEINTKPLLWHVLEVDRKPCFIPFVRRSRIKTDSNLEGADCRTRMFMVRLATVSEFEQLPINHYGIREPSEESARNLEKADPNEGCGLDLIIVPGMAFARDGRRLGHGMGYYDEFLRDWCERAPANRRPYTLGLAFIEQLLDHSRDDNSDKSASSNKFLLPTMENHDFNLDEVLIADPEQYCKMKMKKGQLQLCSGLLGLNDVES